MRIVVTDSNVFVLFFECALLEALLSSTQIEIYIPEKVFQEVTDVNEHRIPNEYPGIPPILQKARHGHGNQENLRIVVKNIQEDIQSPTAIEAYFELEKQTDIDKGEREAIPLAIDLQADFISNDESAVEELNRTYAGSGATGKNIEKFIDELETCGVFSNADCKILKDKLWE